MNTLLWRIVVVDEDVYYEGFRSIFDGDTAFSFTQFDRGMELKKLLPEQTYIERINWFTQDNFKLGQLDNMLVATDLRMGMEPNYFFRFKLADIQDDEIIPIAPQQLGMSRNAKAGLLWVWRRIWNPYAEPIMARGSVNG